jgi:predicted RNA-binding protein with RPS1 domain
VTVKTLMQKVRMRVLKIDPRGQVMLSSKSQQSNKDRLMP